MSPNKLVIPAQKTAELAENDVGGQRSRAARALQESCPPLAQSAASAADTTHVGMLAVAVRTTLVTLLLTGVLYPLTITALSQALFSYRANGSLVTDEGGQIVGSELIGQGFSNPAYMWPRPSAAGANGYDATASSGSNLGPSSQKLRDRIVADIARLTETNPDALGRVPFELVTASASGLDPHLSPAAAQWQVPRIARARGVAPERVRQVVTAQTEGRDLGLLGEPRVNVLLLNLALDHQFGRPTTTQ